MFPSELVIPLAGIATSSQNCDGLIMRNLARIFIYALFNGVLIGVNPAPLVAQEQPEQSDHSELVFNEEVVKKLLNGADPDVAFLARLKMIVGHLYAADFAVERGDLTEARQHITHPVLEILPDIVSVLKERDLKDPSAAMNGILETLQSEAIKQTRTRIYDVVVEIEGLQHSIDPPKMVMDRILADVAVLLLRTAVTEYDEAFKSGKIVNIAEYHAGSAFVTEGTTLIQDAEYEWKTKNPAAYDKLELSLQELQTAWPSEIPPPHSVIPVAKMLALVTTIELQINEIRNSE
jgi:hypothetical protein